MEYFGVLIAFLVAYWVYSDAKSRGKTNAKAFLWFLGVFFLLILFLPLWLITRPKVRLCSHCGKYYEYKAAHGFCPECRVE